MRPELFGTDDPRLVSNRTVEARSAGIQNHHGDDTMARMKASERRTALVEATIRLISRDGLAAASTRAIAAEAGMPLSSLHYVFDSRDQLIALAIRELAIDLGLRIDVEQIDFTSLRSAVRSTIGQSVEHINADPDALLAIHECALYAARTPSLRQIGPDSWAEEGRMVRYFLELLGLKLGLRWTVPIDQLASMVLLITEGMAYVWLKIRDNATSWLGIDAVVATLEQHSRPLEEGEEPETMLLSQASFADLFPIRDDDQSADPDEYEDDSTE